MDSFKYEKCFRRKCTPAGKVVRIYHAVNRAIALFHKQFEKKWKSIEKVNPGNRIFLIVLPIVLPIEFPIELPIELPIQMCHVSGIQDAMFQMSIPAGARAP